MAQALNNLSLSSILISILIILGACDKKNETPSNTCKLIQRSSESTGIKYNTTREYNDRGQIIGAKHVREEKDDWGQLVSSTTRIGSYKYNLDGFLIKEILNSENTDESNFTTTYEYKNARLVKSTSETSSTSYIYTYEYDANGNLIKYIFTNTGNTYTSSGTYDFKTKKVAIKNFYEGEIEGELDENGFLIKEVIAGLEIRFNYNNDGNLIRQETRADGNLLSAVSLEYDNKINPEYVYSTSSFKGMPDLKINRVYFPTHNYTKVTQLRVDGDREVISSSKVYSMEYNSSGYPTVVTISESDEKGNFISTATKTYGYKDCD